MGESMTNKRNIFVIKALKSYLKTLYCVLAATTLEVVVISVYFNSCIKR